MPDPVATPTAPPSSEPPPAEPIPAIIGEDGNFVENWTQRLTDETLHDDPTLKTIKSLDLLASNHVLQRKKIGGNTVLVPNEASTEAEWDAYYAAGGRPETSADYNLTRPEEFPEELWDNERAEKYMKLFHKIGLNQKQVDALTNENNLDVIAAVTKKAQDDELAMTELKNGLYKDWGNAFEQRKHLGNLAIENGTDGNAEFKGRLVQKFGNDPDFIRYSSNLGAGFAEAGSVDTSNLVPTTSDLQTRIKDETAKKSYGADYAKHGFTREQHKDQIEKVARMFAELAKSTKTG